MTKRQYNYSFEQKAKIASRKAVKEKEKEIAKLKRTWRIRPEDSEIKRKH